MILDVHVQKQKDLEESQLNICYQDYVQLFLIQVQIWKLLMIKYQG